MATTVTQEYDKEAVPDNGLTCVCRLLCERLHEQALKHMQLDCKCGFKTGI
jgi:hypothetical protein